MYVSCYPAKRSRKDEKGADDVGVMGNVELVQNATLSTQPINSVDWSPDKVWIDYDVLLKSLYIGRTDGMHCIWPVCSSMCGNKVEQNISILQML